MLPSGQIDTLFHPRTDTWDDHFEWSADETGVLVGKTLRRRATIARLQINDPQAVEVRRLLARLGLLDEAMRQP